MKFRVQKYRIVVTIFFCLLAFLLFLGSESQWEKQQPLISGLLFLLGILLVGIASMGRVWCSLYIAGHKTTALVTEGPYSLTRNPLYFFSLVGSVGVGLCTETFLLPTILIIGFALYYPDVIHKEEKILLEIHHETYREYIASTPRFFPNLKHFSEPVTYLVDPKIFRRHLADALMFVWVVGLLELIEQLHELNWLPVIFNIY
jgi:protein-S-isoprenylcysteine O-methyltransferase Ste14